MIPELLNKIAKKKFHVVDLLFWLVIALLVCLWGFWKAPNQTWEVVEYDFTLCDKD